MVALLLDPLGTVEDTLAILHFLFKTNPTLHRPGRRFPRPGGWGIGAHGFIVTWYAPSLNLMALHRRPLADTAERERQRLGGSR